jgi:hypothetical protein
MSVNKPRIIKDYEKLDEAIQEQIKLEYPMGFSRNLIHFTNKDGLKVSALPFETEDKYYLVRMTVTEAKRIIEDDDDYGDDGVLKDDVKVEYEEKYTDEEDDDLDLVADDGSDDFGEGADDDDEL